METSEDLQAKPTNLDTSLGKTEQEENLDERHASLQLTKSQLETVPGLVYVSFLPPKMTPLYLKQIFSKYGELGRIYLQPDSKSFFFDKWTAEVAVILL